MTLSSSSTCAKVENLNQAITNLQHTNKQPVENPVENKTGPTLCKLLQIQDDKISKKANQGLLWTENAWKQAGAPNKTDDLIVFLETAILECKSADIWYPSIFLRRLKEMERGEFSPTQSK